MKSSVEIGCKMEILTLASIFLFPVPAAAETYKCSAPSGGVVYQDYPCGVVKRPGREEGTYNPVVIRDSDRRFCEDPKYRKELVDAGMPSNATLDQCAPRVGPHLEKKVQANEARVRQYQAEQKAKVELSRKAPSPQIGVTTTDDVRLGRVNWCNRSDFPDIDRNLTETAKGTREQWVCRNYGETYKYLYFENQILTAKQT